MPSQWGRVCLLGPGTSPALQPLATHPPLPVFNWGLNELSAGRAAQLCGLGSFTGASGAASYLAEGAGGGLFLLVLRSLTVINMGSSGWHPWPCWDPSPRAQLSSPKVAARCPVPAELECCCCPAAPAHSRGRGGGWQGVLSEMKAEPACACRRGSGTFFR